MSGWRGCASLHASGRSRASGMLHESCVQGLAPTGCQALCGWCHGFRALPGTVGPYGKIDPAKRSCIIFAMAAEPLTIFDQFNEDGKQSSGTIP